METLYAEFVRLNGILHDYVASSFADFELLAAIGVLFAWEPFASALAARRGAANAADTRRVVFLGFITILFIVTIIAVRDLMKQSIVAFTITEIANVETALRAFGNPETAPYFHTASRWGKWAAEIHTPISLYFRGLFMAFVLVFPAAIMWRYGMRYVVGYLAVAVLLIATYAGAASLLAAGIK